MATAEIDELPAQSDSRREPEVNKLFRIGDEARGVRPAPQGRPAADDAAQGRHPPHGCRRRSPKSRWNGCSSRS